MPASPEVNDLILSLILYGLLPLWVLAGFVDYVCHWRTKIHENSGGWESLMHLCMGGQVALPMWLALTCKINVLILLLCFIVLITHEVVAHYDVLYARTARHISVWEVHAHSFLETIPFFITALVVCRNWEAFMQLITLDWAGHMGLELRDEPIGSEVGDRTFVARYFVLVILSGLLPYLEELTRCLRYAHRHGLGLRPHLAPSRATVKLDLSALRLPDVPAAPPPDPPSKPPHEERP
ncbi:MAG: diguanylate cyclase [Deltaproteobacteria bacterium]|nr:diguanylate cyclase [Deltaproteobacteria bacterium]